MNTAILAANTNPALESIQGPLKAIGTFAIAAVATVFSGMMGSIMYPTPPGVGAIGGCLIGFVVGLTIGCFATGFLRQLTSEKLNPSALNIKNALPHTLAVKVGSYGRFDLILTVHEVCGVQVQGQLPWQTIDTYVQIDCGSNPAKRTCVKGGGKFNEQFKLAIRPTDEAIVLRILDQDIFGSTPVGYVCVDILKDIIQAGFPKRVDFEIEAGETDRLRHVPGVKAAVTLSFDYTDSYPESVRPEKTAMNMAQDAPSGMYGSVGFLTDKVFNPGSRSLGAMENVPKGPKAKQAS